MEDQAVTSLYRKVVSPSLKFKTEELKKEGHIRHVQFGGLQSPLAVRRLNTVSYRNTNSAPGRVNFADLPVKRCDSPVYSLQDKEQTKQYDFHPTTRFKTASLPAMPLTNKYATQSAKGTSRSVPLSASRHSTTTSLPDKRHMLDINPRILYTTQKQRQIAESQAKSECRRLKRKSEIIAHRVDKQYYLCGSKIPVNNRWDVDPSDLLRLKLLAHHKQLAQYQAIKDGQLERLNHRESPGGQMSSPTPSSSKQTGVLTSGQQSPVRPESEGKWADDVKSETSSIDELDIIALRSSKVQSAQSNSQEEKGSSSTTDNVKDGTEEGETEVATNRKDEDESSKEDVKTNDNGTVDGNAISNTEKQEGNQALEKDKTTKPSSSKSTKKVKNLRFQDDIIKKPTNQRRVKSGGKADQKDKSSEEKEKQDDGHVNPYMEEWLGVKKKEVDGRYKPGKPPPNRIFISSEISKSKMKAQATKFSDEFLAEMIALQERLIDADVDITPESRYGIIGDKQKHAFNSMFNEMDKDKNGSVTLEELKLKMMPAVSRDDIKHFVQVFDLNKDKTVDAREFATICCLNDRLAGTRTETADGSIALELEKLAHHIVIFKEMYKTMDEDDDNRLNVNEVLVMVSAAMETEMGSDLNDARRVLAAARDQFGYIDFVGFMSYIPFFAKLLKAIMQNPLSITEIEKARERVRQKELTFKPKKVTKKEPKSWEVY